MKEMSIAQKLYTKIYKEPLGTEDYVNINSIYVPISYLNSNPKEGKIKEYYNRFNKYNTIDKPLIISRNLNTKNHRFIYFLKDGYIRYLIIKDQIDRYMDTYNCKFKKVPESLRYIPIKYEGE